ncbi:MAG: hypothetical protein ACR2RA_00350 [Geminicoccaceae bacterium]
MTRPNGSRLAVSVVVDFEASADLQVIAGDATRERIGEVISVMPEGQPNSGQARSSATARAEAWRTAAALRRHEIPATLFDGRAGRSGSHNVCRGRS